MLGVLSKFFSWDSATAFLTAKAGLVHRRTPGVTVVNTGIIEGIGHFRTDAPRLREPPLNMITLAEAWRHSDRTMSACDFPRTLHGLDGLDQRILEAIDPKPGFFVELGAYDGITQSNSVLLEALGWRGLLIEATPSSYAKCVRARPQMIVEHAACVATGRETQTTVITDVGLMSITSESDLAGDERAAWLEARGRAPQEIEVPAVPMSELLDKHGIEKVDLLLLDVEGAEVEVLNGIDFDRQHRR